MKFLMACLVMLLLFPDKLLAQTTLPHVFNFHTTLRDDDGNLIQNDFIDLEFQIVDGQGNILFSESQPGVQVVRSAVAVVVGEESGGIPLEVFDPATGAKLLKYKIAGNEFSDGIELNTYPYSLWSEKALGVVDDAIGSEQIKDGSIELKDLARSIEFTDVKGITTEAQIPTSFATDVELTAHANASQAHWAKQIRVEGPFMLHTSTNVEDLLSTLDAKVYLNMVNAKEDVTKASTGLTTTLNQEIADRKAADTTLQTDLDTEMANRKTEDANVLASEVSRAGDSIYGDLTFFTDSGLGTETLRIAPAEGEISLVGDLIRVEKDDATGQPLIVVEDKDKNEKVKINGSDGTITLNGSLVLSGTVDGVDVGDMNVSVASHAAATTAHGSDGTVVGVNTLNSAIVGHATLKTGVHGLISADPSNALVGTTETQTLSNKTLESPVINTPTITGGSFSGTLSNTTGNHNGTVEGVDMSDLNGTVSTNSSNISSLQTTTSDINKIPGTLGEGKIDGTIARDAEVSSAISSAQTNLETKINTAQSTADSAASTASTAQSTANTAVSNASTAQTTANNAATAAATAQSTADGKLSKSGGGTITGDLQVNGNIGVTGTVDGYDVSAKIENHETRIGALEGKTKFSDIEGQIAESQVPKFMRPFAFGMLTTNVVGDVTISGSYNMKQPTGSAAVQCGVTLEFETASEDGNFLVILQEHQNSAHPRAIDKNKNGFKVCNANPSLVDFVVYKN